MARIVRCRHPSAAVIPRRRRTSRLIHDAPLAARRRVKLTTAIIQILAISCRTSALKTIASPSCVSSERIPRRSPSPSRAGTTIAIAGAAIAAAGATVSIVFRLRRRDIQPAAPGSRASVTSAPSPCRAARNQATALLTLTHCAQRRPVRDLRYYRDDRIPNMRPSSSSVACHITRLRLRPGVTGRRISSSDRPSPPPLPITRCRAPAQARRSPTLNPIGGSAGCRDPRAPPGSRHRRHGAPRQDRLASLDRWTGDLLDVSTGALTAGDGAATMRIR